MGRRRLKVSEEEKKAIVFGEDKDEIKKLSFITLENRQLINGLTVN